MREDEPAVEDLGAATERTQGIWDPIQKETHMDPESWDL